MKPIAVFLFLLTPILGEAAPPTTAQEAIDTVYSTVQISPQKSEDLWNKVRLLIRDREKLAGDKAAQAWFELFKKWGAKGSVKSKPNTPSLFAALPGPNGWKPLDDLVKDLQLKPAKAGMMLRLLTATLLADRDRQWAIAAELAQLPASEKVAAERLYLALASQTSEPGKLRAAFEFLTAKLQAQESNSFGSSTWQVPDLIKMVGEEEAAKMLLRLIDLKSVTLKFDTKEMRDLARKVAMEHLDELRSPPWKLVEVESAEDAGFFEKVRAKFPETATYPAIESYLIYHIKAGNVDAAAAVFDNGAKNVGCLQNISRNAAEEFTTKEWQGNYKQFLEKMLLKLPDDPVVWIALVEASRDTGDVGDVLKRLEKTAGAVAELDSKKVRLRAPIIDESLETGKVQEAVDLLWSQLSGQYGDGAAGTLLRLYKIGMAAEDGALVQKVSQAVLALDPSTVGTDLLCQFLPLLQEQKDLARMWDMTLVMTGRALKDGRTSSEGDTAMATICELFVLEGRGSEAIKMMEEAPWWSLSQLRDLVLVKTWTKRSFGLVAADAFLQAGRKKDASAVLKRTILRGASSDDVYEKLVEIEGGSLIAYLDALVTADPFQERPLIWKAVLLLQSGKLEGAETAIRKAIEIDPSDGESGKNDRLRTYSVLADILDAKGASDDAAAARNVVQAVRLSEDADDLLSAGMRSKAIDLYKTALKTFSDAYCIQSRLAVQLARAGRMEEATAHYERAYELMPSSFGRIESHCFGCEGVFRGSEARGIAERTFLSLVQATPDSARLHYLLGSLRQNELRWKEAAASYEAAVRLDPEYYNAWKRLEEVVDAGSLGFDIKQRAILNLIRLDPLNLRRSHQDIKDVADVKQLWEVLAANAIRIRPVEIPFWFPMAASMEARTVPQTDGVLRYGDPARYRNPAEALLEQNIIKIAVESLAQAAR